MRDDSYQDSDEDFSWRVRRCPRFARADAIASLRAEGYIIHDHYENPRAQESEEIVIIARKPL